MKIPSLAVILRLSSYAGRRKMRTSRAKFTSCKFYKVTVRPNARFELFLVRLRENVFGVGTTSRRSFSPLISVCSPFIPILILSSGEKIDLPIMGNRYERERATTQGVVCTSAATSQTRVRINRSTQPPTRRLTWKEKERERLERV